MHDIHVQLLSRQESQSPYNEYLYIVNTGGGDFELQRRVHATVGPVLNPPQRGTFFDSTGKRITPKTFEGSKILGYVDLDGQGSDHEYAFLERIIQTPLENDVLAFSAESIGIAKAFCDENGWTSCKGFSAAWQKLTNLVERKNNPT